MAKPMIHTRAWAMRTPGHRDALCLGRVLLDHCTRDLEGWPRAMAALARKLGPARPVEKKR